jgi:hypothetical protein
MENQNTSFESKTKNITLESLLSWTVGVVFAISGFAMLFSSFTPGLFLLLTAALLIKPIRLFIMKKLHLSLSRKVKLGLVVIFLIMVGVTMDTKPQTEIATKNEVPQTQPVATQQAPAAVAIPKTLEEKITEAITASLGVQNNTDKPRIVSVEIEKYNASMLTMYKYPSGSKISGILVKINASENLTTNLQKGSMHGEAVKVFQAVFPTDPTIGDVIIWSQLPVKDQYGNLKDDTAIIYSMSRSLFDKVNWTNYNHRDLPTLLKSEGKIDDRNNYYESIKF